VTRHVTIAELGPFLRDFTVTHRAQPVTLEVVVGSTRNIQESGVPLVGLDLETKGPDAPALEILLGDELSGEKRHLSHIVPRVQAIEVELDAKGAEQRLVIAGDDGSQAVLSID
jgi:hypothetical protein